MGMGHFIQKNRSIINMPIIIKLDYEILLFENSPCTIGIVVRGREEPKVDEKRYIDFVSKISPSFTSDMQQQLIECPHIHITVNNDPDRPEDEFFIISCFDFFKF